MVEVTECFYSTMIFSCGFFLCVCRLTLLEKVQLTVDYGGPRREFFRLLLLRLADDNSLHYHGVEGKNWFCATGLDTSIVRHVLVVIEAKTIDSIFLFLIL